DRGRDRGGFRGREAHRPIDRGTRDARSVDAGAHGAAPAAARLLHRRAAELQPGTAAHLGDRRHRGMERTRNPALSTREAAAGKMNLARADVGGAVLVVSQFTLYGDATKGRRPSFVDAAAPEIAIPLYERFVALIRERGAGSGVQVATGEFGAMMEVELVNDGPVTLIFEK